MGRYLKASPEWRQIVADNRIWFDPSVMKFWNTRVYWQTLTEYEDGYLFVTSEDNYLRTERLFSIRFVKGDNISTPMFQEFDCLDCARDHVEHLLAVSRVVDALLGAAA